MLYTRDVEYRVTIIDKEDGEKVEDRVPYTARNTSKSFADIKKDARESAKKRAAGEYGINDPKISITGVKERLYDGSH